MFSFAFTFGIYAIALFLTLRPVGTPNCDLDVWWHLRDGKWIAEHRTVPHTDPFSAYGQQRTWIAYSWLYELLLFALYTACGLAGVVIYRAVLALAITLAVHRFLLRGNTPEPIATALTAVCLVPLSMLFSERPWLFTILFGTLTLHAVFDLREGRRTPLPWLLPLVFVVWTNVHIQFIYGLALLVLACAAPMIDQSLGIGDAGTAAQFRSVAWYKTLVLAVACTLATLINPYHLRIYGVIVEYATQLGPFQYVNELKSPAFREPGDWAILGLTIAAAFTLGRKRRVHCFDLSLLVLCSFLSFRSRRDTWLVSLAACGLLTAAVNRAEPRAASRRWTAGWHGALAVALILFAVGLAFFRNLSPSRLERTAATIFPAAACRYVVQHNLRGPMYNDFNWGGYLIWALPALPVAFDGRTNLHGDERILRSRSTWLGGPDWFGDPDLSAAGFVVAPVETPLASLLKTDKRFSLVYEDPVACVFVATRVSSPRSK